MPESQISQGGQGARDADTLPSPAVEEDERLREEALADADDKGTRRPHDPGAP